MDSSGMAIPALRGLRAIAARLADLWRGLGLIAQFLLLTTLMLITINVVSSQAEHRIAARNMIQSALEVEQALALAILLPVIGDQPLDRPMAAAQVERLDRSVARSLDRRFINKLKVWGLDGALLYDSTGHASGAAADEPAVLRALQGETVMSLVDRNAAENTFDWSHEAQIYEVYMPIYSTAGRLLGVGEIYCSVELLVERLRKMNRQTDLVRAAVLALGIAGMTALVLAAQRRLFQQEDQLNEMLRETVQLARRNAELLNESEDLRRSSAEAGEQLLNHIGAELHDGPIQLLSIAALYRAQSGEAVEGDSGKAHRLTEQALRELRNISVGLILPELEGASIQQAIRQAIGAFQSDCGLNVTHRLPEPPEFLPLPLLVVSYRIVYESLHNARKHAGGRGLMVTLTRVTRGIEIVIRDRGPANAPRPAAGGHPGRPALGQIGMAKRARSVGGTLEVLRNAQGTEVHLFLPV